MFILWFLAWSPQVPILLMCKLLILYQRHGSLIDYIKNLSNEFLLNYVFRLWEHSEILIWNCRYYKKFMIHYGSEGAIHRCWKNSFIIFFFQNLQKSTNAGIYFCTSTCMISTCIPQDCNSIKKKTPRQMFYFVIFLNFQDSFFK